MAFSFFKDTSNQICAHTAFRPIATPNQQSYLPSNDTLPFQLQHAIDGLVLLPDQQVYIQPAKRVTDRHVRGGI